MTVENTNSRRKTYDGNGSTTDFPITFDYVDDDTINVVHIDADDVETEWVLDGAGDTGFTIVSGEVVANTAPATDETLIIYRETDYTQERDLKNNRRTSDEVLEAAYDKLTHLAQELSETSDRALQFDITYTGDIVDAGDYMDLMVAHEAAAAVSAAAAAVSAAAAAVSAAAAAVSAAAYNVVTDLAADVTAAGSADTTLIVSDIQTLSANLTIPTNITLDIKHSGQITGAYTLTINGGIVAGSNQRIFGDSVTVSIVDCVDSISPNWWGFSVSETAANNATYLQAAIDAPLNGGRVRMIPGAYSIDEITFAANNLLIFEGSGWDTVLTYAGTSDFATITINAQSGLIVRDFKVVGSATTGHCFVTNVGQCQFDNLFVSGFSQANKAAFFTTGELYNLSITNSRVQDCYDGIYFNHGATTSCNFENLFIRGWTRYGIALLGTAPLPSYSNRIVSCIIDEPVGSTGTAGIYFQRNYTSIIENCFFESETKAIHCNIAGNTSIRGNTFGSGITTAIQLDAGVGDTILKLNRYLSGSITDSGIRTYHLDDALHHGIGQAPEAWSSDYAALQMGGNAAWYSQYVQGTSNASWFTNNAYYDGSHRYIVNDQVSAYLQSDGAHYFYGAAPAAADSVISWALGFSISVDGLLTALPTYSSIVGGTNRDLYIDDTGLIGYVSSSKRYKENVVDMGDTSWVYKLRPVRFDYIQEQGGHHSYGLIAEEVSLISEYLVTRDKEGREESVEYSKLTPILLNEVLFLRERIQQLEQRKSIFSSLVDFLRKIFKYGNIKLQHNKRR